MKIEYNYKGHMLNSYEMREIYETYRLLRLADLIQDMFSQEYDVSDDIAKRCAKYIHQKMLDYSLSEDEAIDMYHSSVKAMIVSKIEESVNEINE